MQDLPVTERATAILARELNAMRAPADHIVRGFVVTRSDARCNLGR